MPAVVTSELIPTAVKARLLLQVASLQLWPPIKYNLLSDVAKSIGSLRDVNGTVLATNFIVLAAVSNAVYTLPPTASTTTNCQPPTIAIACPVIDSGQMPEGTTDGTGSAIHDGPPVQVL
jgi:hypothetical protein